MWIVIKEIVSFLADIIQIITGILVLFVAWTQRDKISAAFSVLLSYSLQASLSDFKHWLALLQENSNTDEDISKKFRHPLAHIFGKIKGNQTLYRHFGEKMLKRINVMLDDLDDNKTISTTRKITLCSEIQESLTTLEIENYKLKE